MSDRRGSVGVTASVTIGSSEEAALKRLDKSDYEIEAIIWCPGCKIDLWKVERRPVSQEGVFENRLVAIDGAPLIGQASHKLCGRCGANLERKP